MKVFLKTAISELGILGSLLAAFFVVGLSPLLVLIRIFSLIGDFNEWSMTWFDSEVD